MSEAVGEIVPLALGVAFSPFSLLAAGVILAVGVDGSRALAFVLGWILALFVISASVGILGLGSGNPSDTTRLLIQLSVAALFVAIAAYEWRHRDDELLADRRRRALDRVYSLRPAQAAVAGFAWIAINPKNLILAATAGSSLTGLEGADSGLALALFVALASFTVVIPLLLLQLAGDSFASRTVTRVRREIEERGSVIAAVAMVLVGLLLGGQAVLGLT